MNDASPFRSLHISDELVDTFTRLICDGSEGEAARMVEQLTVGGMDAEAVMMELLAPSARLMGEFWCQDRRDFLEVTLGLTRLQQLVRQFIDNFAQFEDHVDESVRKAAPVAA